MIEAIQQGLRSDGLLVSISKLCRWFGIPRCTVCYKPTKSEPRINPAIAEPIKALIEQAPSFGYRTVTGLLDMNKNTVQRVFQLMGWQVRKRATGHRPRIEALPSVAQRPDERWATGLCRIWGGRDGWLTLALVIDCFTRQLLGWQLVDAHPELTHGGQFCVSVNTQGQAVVASLQALGADSGLIDQ